MHKNLDRSLALREFALGIDALERFVAVEPLYRVHEWVLASLPSRGNRSILGCERPAGYRLRISPGTQVVVRPRGTGVVVEVFDTEPPSYLARFPTGDDAVVRRDQLAIGKQAQKASLGHPATAPRSWSSCSATGSSTAA